MTEKVTECYICSSTKYVDNHHIDCQHGKVSPETVPLCRRCHRTYHDRGIEWFEDEFLDKMIGIENRRRALFNLPFIQREDIERSDYWYKKHGKKRPMSEAMQRLFQTSPARSVVRPGIQPLCGWQWIEEYISKVYPEQNITISHNGKNILTLSSSDKHTKRTIKTAISRMENTCENLILQDS